MSPHVHDWRLRADIPLTVADTSGHFDRLMHWECASCPMFSTITGWFARGSRMSYEQLVTRAQEEAQQGDVYAQIAARNEALLRRQRRVGTLCTPA